MFWAACVFAVTGVILSIDVIYKSIKIIKGETKDDH